MDRVISTSALAAVIIAGAAFGIHLGDSAISQINPLYFQGPAVHPRDRGAEVDANPIDSSAPRYAELYGWAEGQEARAADCADCPALVARDAYRGGSQFAVIETGWQTKAQPTAYSVETEPQAAPAEEPEAEAEGEPFVVERYAAFAIEEKPPAAEPAEAVSAQE